jgi:hypothetical protein
MKYICKECKETAPCLLDTGDVPNSTPPDRCVVDGYGCKWENAEACALAEAAEKEASK